MTEPKMMTCMQEAKWIQDLFSESSSNWDFTFLTFMDHIILLITWISLMGIYPCRLRLRPDNSQARRATRRLPRFIQG